MSSQTMTESEAKQFAVDETTMTSASGKKIKVIYVPSAPVHAYLYLYNLICWLGWIFFSYKVLSLIPPSFIKIPFVNEHLPESSSWDHIFPNCWPIISRLQILALLEILHVKMKFTMGSVSATVTQVLGRNLNLFFFTWYLNFSTVQNSPAVALTYFSWCLIELVRYPVYMFSLAPRIVEVFSKSRKIALKKAREESTVTESTKNKGKTSKTTTTGKYHLSPPYFLLWLRYSLWIILYPIGATAEAWTMYNVSAELYPVYLETSDVKYLVGTVLIYCLMASMPFFLFKQGLYLWKQRKKKLSTKTGAVKPKQE